MSEVSTPSAEHTSLPMENLDTETRLGLAIKAINEAPLGRGGRPTLSVRAAASMYGLKRGILTNRLNGIKSKQEAHAHERILSEAEEIAGKKVGTNWPRHFMKRHPELKIKKTSTLEECRARSLNPTVVAQFYDMIKDLIEEYNIPPENIYNADEKGIQLGVGKSVSAIVDRNQKNVQQVENGNREMVTIIESVCADGTSLPPSVIFQAKRRVLEWGKENPSNASISISENGWTDKELGSLWVERDFHPTSQKRNKSNGYRLLILDGHNSHCTFKFCRFAERNRIIVVCLPSHTTHALQPCDAGVFSPLSSSWKTLVNRLTRDGIAVTKLNFLKHYYIARHKAFKSSTIISAFAKSGIWPLNPHAIPLEAYKPSKNTTTKAAMPVSADLTPLLEPIDDEAIPANTTAPSTTDSIPSTSSAPVKTPSATSAFSDKSSASQVSQRYRLVGIPPPLPHTAGRVDLRKQINELRALLEKAQVQIECDHAIKVVMDKENERLRQILYNKETDKKKTFSPSNPRYLTAEKTLDELAYTEWKGGWKAMLKEAGKALKACRKSIEEAEKEAAQEVKQAEQDAKRRECEAEKQKKEEEKTAEQERKKEESEAAKQRKEEEKAAERERKIEERAAKAAEKAVEKAEKQAAAAVRGTGRGRGRGQGRGRGRGQGRGQVGMPGNHGGDQSADLEDAVAEGFDDKWEEIRDILYDPPERPRPRPILRQHAAVPPTPPPETFEQLSEGTGAIIPQRSVETESLRRNPRRTSRNT